jgi:hypothetical protein
MSSGFPRHHRSTSPDRAEVLMVALVTIPSPLLDGISTARDADLIIELAPQAA